MTARRHTWLSGRVHAFMIWREGTSVDWECTATELAEAVGLTRGTVSRICRERGWPVLDGRLDAAQEIRAADVYMRGGC